VEENERGVATRFNFNLSSRNAQQSSEINILDINIQFNFIDLTPFAIRENKSQPRRCRPNLLKVLRNCQRLNFSFPKFSCYVFHADRFKNFYYCLPALETSSKKPKISRNLKFDSKALGMARGDSTL